MSTRGLALSLPMILNPPLLNTRLWHLANYFLRKYEKLPQLLYIQYKTSNISNPKQWFGKGLLQLTRILHMWRTTEAMNKCHAHQDKVAVGGFGFGTENMLQRICFSTISTKHCSCAKCNHLFQVLQSLLYFAPSQSWINQNLSLTLSSQVLPINFFPLWRETILKI